ncbi:MAG: hypothetical protein JO150_10935 [Acidobacteriaceae bacterium]|nr:hypothetical protein [Acidobacteriaceae bacterium]
MTSYLFAELLKHNHNPAGAAAFSVISRAETGKAALTQSSRQQRSTPGGDARAHAKNFRRCEFL